MRGPTQKIHGTKAARLSKSMNGLGTLALRLPDDPDIGPRRLPPFRIDLLRLLVRHRACDDHVVAAFPVCRRGHAVLGSKLERVDHPENLVEVAPSGHGIDEDQLDLL